MSTSPAKVVIVGAGAVGVLAGYDLTRAGSQVTYLVRPHRTEQLARPQALYSYDDNTLDHLTGYDVITDPAALTQVAADLVIVTLDGAALRAEAGQQLAGHIGTAYRGAATGVVLATGGVGIRSWFLEQSGLSEDQVAVGGATAQIYDVSSVTLPADPAIDQELLGQADYAYRHGSPAGFIVDDSAPRVTETLLGLYSGEGVRAAASVPATQLALGLAGLGPMMAWSLLGWTPAADIEADDPTWKLGVASMREIMSLFGDAGRGAAEQTDPAGVLASFRQTTEAMEPLDYAAFNAYTHGGKLHDQNLGVLEQAREAGAADGIAMPALGELIERLRAA